MTTVYERRADFASDNLADHFGLAEQIEIGAGCLDRCDMMPTGGASQGFTFDQCAYVVMQ